jgi:hypothetical protein
VSLACQLVGASAAALVPAAVLIWRSDAWRSARAVLVGAIAWTTLPAGASLAWWVVRRSPVLMDRIGYEVAVGVAAATVVAYLGPGIVAVGLERLRRHRTAWLDYWAQRGAAVTVLATLYNVARWTPPAADASGGFAPPVQAGPAGLDTLHLAATVGAAALPVELLCLSILAFVCFSAVSDGEAQRRLWQCAAAGAGLLAAIAVYQLLAAELPANVSSTGPAGSGWEAAALGATLMAGFGLVSLAFGSPVWSAARDAEGAGRAAPEAIFAWGTAAEADGSDPIPMSTVMAVAAGADHALALDDQGRVGSWGDDSMGQADVPAGLSGVVAVAAGNGFSLALRSDGTVAGWGANDLGQTNLPAGLSGVAAIAAGSGFGLALKADGTVAGWGDGGLGATALPAGLCDVTAISAGKHHALALRADGTLVAWGDDSYGQADVPAGLRRVKAISAGGDFSLALLADGTVVAWGDDSYGQLDVPAGLASVVEISAGAFHALALRADGDVVGWGGGGQRFGEAFHPWRLVDFKAVAAGDGFSLAIRAA